MTHLKSYAVAWMLVVAAVWTMPVASSASMTTIPFDSRQTYLLTNQDPNALDAIPIGLGSLGLSGGMEIGLQVIGQVCYYWDGSTCHIGPSTPWSVAGVFSSTSQLGPSNILNRVYGAIVSDGQPVFTIPTYIGNLSTDIAEDFSIVAIGENSSGPWTIVTIPTGAQFLFVNINDSFFGDNYSTDLALRITAVPEPSALILLSSGLIGLAGLTRRKLLP